MFSVTELALQISQRTLPSAEFHGCFACSFPFREGVTSSFFLFFVDWCISCRTLLFQHSTFSMFSNDHKRCAHVSLNRVISYQVFERISDYSPDSSEYVKDEGDCERAEVILTDLHGDFGGVGGDARVVGFLLLGLLHAGGASAKITGLSLLGLATLL